VKWNIEQNIRWKNLRRLDCHTADVQGPTPFLFLSSFECMRKFRVDGQAASYSGPEA
jgi:hypothetical protein